MGPIVTISIVSHKHSAYIRTLLQDLAQFRGPEIEIIVTINTPEIDDHFCEGGLIANVIRNPRPKGYGDNHNTAFAISHAPYFAVLNPDLRVNALRMDQLLEAFIDTKVGLCAPAVRYANGETADSARIFPSIPNLVARYIGRRHILDYPLSHNGPLDVDWVAGMFMLFRRSAFLEVGGFDTRYFMYCEDIDICRRLNRAGWRVRFQPSTHVVHATSRASHRSAQHMRWHARSMVRFISGF